LLLSAYDWRVPSTSIPVATLSHAWQPFPFSEPGVPPGMIVPQLPPLLSFPAADRHVDTKHRPSRADVRFPSMVDGFRPAPALIGTVSMPVTRSQVESLRPPMRTPNMGSGANASSSSSSDVSSLLSLISLDTPPQSNASPLPADGGASRTVNRGESKAVSPSIPVHPSSSGMSPLSHATSISLSSPVPDAVFTGPAPIVSSVATPTQPPVIQPITPTGHTATAVTINTTSLSLSANTTRLPFLMSPTAAADALALSDDSQ